MESVVSALSLQAKAQCVHYRQLENEILTKNGIIVFLMDVLLGKLRRLETLLIETAQQGFFFTLCHVIVKKKIKLSKICQKWTKQLESSAKISTHELFRPQQCSAIYAHAYKVQIHIPKKSGTWRLSPPSSLLQVSALWCGQQVQLLQPPHCRGHQQGPTWTQQVEQLHSQPPPEQGCSYKEPLSGRSTLATHALC